MPKTNLARFRRNIPIPAGTVFGYLTVIREATPTYVKGTSEIAGARWLCKCACGKIKSFRAYSLRNGESTSCGCMRNITGALTRTRHGKSKTPVYEVWKAMKTRCECTTNPSYPGYGGRGIKVCKRWKCFENFYADMGDPPLGQSLDRIDNSKGYSKRNCRWASRLEQQNNMRKNISISYKGKVYSGAALSRLTGIRYKTILDRHARGWPVSKIVSLKNYTGHYNRK